MRYLPEHSITFIHNPKTAGTSISQWLDDNFKTVAGRKHGNYEEVQTYFPNTVYTFGVVRNPWSRLVSWYKFRGQGAGTFEEWFWDRYSAAQHNALGFNSNLIWARNWYTLITPQCNWFDDETVVLKFEELETDFGIIQEKLQCKLDLPNTNNTPVDDYTQYYNRDLAETVRDIYLDDVIKFGYEFGI